MTGPAPGHVRLYTAIRPALQAGTYRLSTQQVLRFDAQDHPLPASQRDLHLVAPRFRMSGSELLSTFPPAFAHGPFTNRFAQVALRRRTLPWERDPGAGADGRKTPWLMLVVLAAGEGDLQRDVPLSSADLSGLRQAVGLSSTAAAQAGTCDVLRVTGLVVRRCFPAGTDLPYLVHVREVNLLDTEAAARDDDGFVAVVASNRVLRGGQSYDAFLVSVEGQLGVLHGPRGTTTKIGPATMPPRILRPGLAREATDALFGGNVAVAGALGHGVTGVLRSGTQERLDGWQATTSETTTSGAGSSVAHELFLGGARIDLAGAAGLDDAPQDEVPGDSLVHRFPVLAHWSFQTIGDGDFESVMTGLDVGLLGTVDPAADDAPTVVPTGHVLLDRQTRQGVSTAGWYRGPLVPHELDDRDDVPLHAAEQALRIGADGIEDLSYAAAFEVGRLMALSDPRFVAALVGWRRGGDLRRWRAVSSAAFATDLLPPLALDRFDRLLSLDLVDRLLGFGEGMRGPLGPLVNPVPWEVLYETPTDVARLERIGMARTQIENALGIDLVSGFGPGPGLVETGVGPITLDELADLGPGGLQGVLDRAFDRDLRGIDGIGGGP